MRSLLLALMLPGFVHAGASATATVFNRTPTIVIACRWLYPTGGR